MKDTNHVALMVLAALAIGVTGFFVGKHTNFGFQRQWGLGSQMLRNGEAYGMHGRMMGGVAGGYAGIKGGFGMMGGFGEITKIDGNTITFKIDEETIREVTLSDDAVINTMTKGSVGDLVVGQQIMVSGGGFWNDSQTVIVRPE